MTSSSSAQSVLPIPKNWKSRLKSAVLSAFSLMTLTLTAARAKILQSGDPISKLSMDVDRWQQEVGLLREELRILRSRLEAIPANRRPLYRPVERMAILELRAARCWSLVETARRFLVTPETISHWLQRLDQVGEHCLTQLREPVNKFPQFVQYLVQRLRTHSPALGKAKLAQTLARAGLHLGTTTVGRMLSQEPLPTPKAESENSATPKPTKTEDSPKIVTAKRPHHVWHVDLTAVPLGGGFWTTWFPLTLPQWWPFGWWLVVVVDHYSRRALHVQAWRRQPTSADVQRALAAAIRACQATPKYLVCDRGPQFDCHSFRRWSKRRHIKLRYGAIGKHGSIAVVERFIRTLKELLRALLVPLEQKQFDEELKLICGWYNEHRPHEFLHGKTPNEVYFHRRPQNQAPRFEPRAQWPRGSPCAKPRGLIQGKPGVVLELELAFQQGRKHLPLISVRRAA